jgi:hypothetical protein
VKGNQKKTKVCLALIERLRHSPLSFMVSLPTSEARQLIKVPNINQGSHLEVEDISMSRQPTPHRDSIRLSGRTIAAAKQREVPFQPGTAAARQTVTLHNLADEQVPECISITLVKLDWQAESHFETQFAEFGNSQFFSEPSLHPLDLIPCVLGET